MTNSPWRAHSRNVIRNVIAANPGADEATLRKLISAEYPFGERAYHPYKIWLSEVKVQLASLRLRQTQPQQLGGLFAPQEAANEQR